MAAAHPGTSLPDKIVVSIVGHSAVPRDEKCHKSIRYLLRSSYEKLFPDEPQPVVHYSGHPGLTLNCTEQWESIYADVNRRKSTCVLIYAGDNDLFTKKVFRVLQVMSSSIGSWKECVILHGCVRMLKLSSGVYCIQGTIMSMVTSIRQPSSTREL